MSDAPVSQPAVQPPAAPPASGLAIAALVCGSVGAFLALGGICTVGLGAVLGLMAGIVGLILSIMAMRRIRRSAGQMGGRSLAIGGMATSIAAVVLGLLIAAAMVMIFAFFPRFKDTAQQARIAAARVDIANIEVAIDAFELDCGRLPSTEEGLRALLDQPSVATGWKGPYLKRGTPKDPWANLYLYRCPGQHNPNRYDLYSFGLDGLEGTEDDIGNWSEVP
ncbi:MAG: type II secretion system major pseudopilin GspG [Planctomycetota bacterium]|nr:type II secretion system major pseudopilin GspG [Planctomycetota bacterium]